MTGAHIFRPFLAAAAGAVAWAAPSAAVAQSSQGSYGPHMWDGAWQGWFMGPLMMIVFLVIAVLVVVLVVRWIGGGHATPPHAPSGRAPLDILKERYARGEIDREEYEERRRVLDG